MNKTITSVFIIALVAIGAYAVIAGPFSQGAIPSDVHEYFTETMREKVVSEIGQPIEGFEPSMFLSVFPGLVKKDFDGVPALLGTYRLSNGELIFEESNEQPIHSAAHAIDDEGMEKLLQNISKRLSVTPDSRDAVDIIVEEISADSITGTLQEVDEEAGTITLQVAERGEVRVVVEEETSLFDLFGLPVEMIAGLEKGSLVDVTGFLNDDGSWGASAVRVVDTESDVVVTRYDQGKTFTFAPASRFIVVVPRGAISGDPSCAPEGVIGDISNEPTAGLAFVARQFETVKEGTCTFVWGGFSFNTEVSEE